MMDDRDLDQKVRTWLDEPPPGPPDRNAVYARVMDRLPETRQRRHWWPFQWNPFAAGATRSAEADGPHQHGRSRTMFSPVKAIIAGALVFALGGVLFVAQPFDQQDGVPLAQDAQDEPVTPVVVIGNSSTWMALEDATCEVVGGVTHCRGAVSSGYDTMSDPRVSGKFVNTFNADYFDEPSGRLYWGTHVLDGATGGWDCTWSGLKDPYPDSGNDGLIHGVCAGTGDYEGLTYTWYRVFTFGFGFPGTFSSSFGDDTDLHGIIYADELPSLTPPFVTEE